MTVDGKEIKPTSSYFEMNMSHYNSFKISFTVKTDVEADSVGVMDNSGRLSGLESTVLPGKTYSAEGNAESLALCFFDNSKARDGSIMDCFYFLSMNIY